MKKYKNPLRRRVFRELKDEWPKYLVIFLLLTLTIGFVAGMYVANGSMLTSASEAKESQRLEEGHFSLKKEASKSAIRSMENGERKALYIYYRNKARKKADKKIREEFEKEFTKELKKQVPAASYQEAYDRYHDRALEAVRKKAYRKIDKKVSKAFQKVRKKYGLDKRGFEKRPTSIYENFYRDTTETFQAGKNAGVRKSDVRVYKVRKDIDLASILSGKLPASENEIAIDRMHADNIGVTVGDTLTIDGKKFRVSGLVANVDYSCLFQKNTDVMFDALTFDVALVSEKGFDRLSGPIVYNYSYVFTEEAGSDQIVRPEDDVEAREWSDDFMTVVLTQSVFDHDNEIKDFLPAYANQAITFTTTDMGSDKAMGGVLLYILVAVLAFVFAVTIRNTIQKEAPVIGTLRAAGYTRGELIRHYLAMPVIVVLLSAGVGNLLGYTAFKFTVVDMYYNSYSLPAYHTVFSTEAILKTTILPVIIMFAVNLLVISLSLRKSPLAFLRSDLSGFQKKRSLHLRMFSFMKRFKIRVFLQNIPGYAVLFVGILFVSLLLSMAVGLPDTLDYYKSHASEMMTAKYQTMLTSWEDDDGHVITTGTKDAEPFGSQTLIRKSSLNDEEVSAFGIQKNSSYVSIPSYRYSKREPAVYISKAYGDKYGVSAGDTIRLHAQFTEESYRFRVKGIYEKNTWSIAVYMPISQYREVFDLERKEFSGFFSDRKIKDIPDKYIATTLTQDSITRLCDQLDHSMGSYMVYFQYICVIVAAILMYLLTKLIIERNENAISMTKILGYHTKEIASIYLTPTTIAVLAFDLIGTFLGAWAMKYAWDIIMLQMEGWYDFTMTGAGYAKIFLFILIGYVIVMILDFLRIRKIPMGLALKNTG